MANDIKTNPNTIQRNLRDVATELTQLYFSTKGTNHYTLENIQEAYRLFYATAMRADSMEYEECDEILNK